LDVLAPPQCNRESKIHEPWASPRPMVLSAHLFQVFLALLCRFVQTVRGYLPYACQEATWWGPMLSQHLAMRQSKCRVRVSLSLEQGVSGEPPVVDCRVGHHTRKFVQDSFGSSSYWFVQRHCRAISRTASAITLIPGWSIATIFPQQHVGESCFR
jgi:hypothetical protein